MATLQILDTISGSTGSDFDIGTPDSVTIQVAGTYVGSVNLFGSLDGSNWSDVGSLQFGSFRSIPLKLTHIRASASLISGRVIVIASF